MSERESHAGEAISQLPAGLREWLALERFHLHKIHNYQRLERDPSFDASYLPQHCGAFRLPCFLVPRKNLHVFGSQLEDPDGMRFHVDASLDGSILFPIHPLALPEYRPFLQQAGAIDAAHDGIHVWAVPTSSTRTLLVWPDGIPNAAACVKTSLNSPAFGDRRVQRFRAARSVGLSTLVAGEREELPRNLQFLLEPFAFAARAAPGTGAIIRPLPCDIVGGSARLVPLFALLGGEETKREPLLLTLVERTSTPPVQLLDQMLCKPFAKLWIELSLRFGWILESHAQDLLLELTPQLLPTGRLYYRDFEGMQVDWELRRRSGRPAPDDLPNAWQWHDSYDTWGARPYCDLTWYKWSISLIQFLRAVLHEMESSLQQWHQRGLVGGPACAPGELTMAFSRHVFTAIESGFGVSAGTPYDIDRSLNRFLLLLGKLRREIIGTPSARSAELAA